MENSNSVQLHIDLSTEQGKAILAAVYSAVTGASTTAPLAKTKAVADVQEPKAPTVKSPVLPSIPPIATPSAPVAPSAPTPPAAPMATPSFAPPAAPVAPSAPTPPAAPAAPVAPSAPTPPAAPAAPKAAKAPKAAAAPAVDFADLDEDGKREAVKKLTTKWSKKGKTTDVKALFAAYGSANVESIAAEYLDHFNWAISTFDTNGQDMAAVLATFGTV